MLRRNRTAASSAATAARRIILNRITAWLPGLGKRYRACARMRKLRDIVRDVIPLLVLPAVQGSKTWQRLSPNRNPARSRACACSTSPRWCSGPMPRRCSATSAPTSSRSSRRRATPRATPARACSRDMASLFMGVNRNKRSIVLDLKSAPARDVLLRLVDRADVFVHNIRPQKLEQLGLGADALLARNPRLIYAGIHGWREDGPYSGRPAYDDIIQGLCGVASLMDQLTGEPRYAPTILCDKTCGLVAAQAILAALYSPREDRPRPVRRNSDVRDHGVLHHGRASARPDLRSAAGRTAGYSRVLAPWRRPYRTADGYRLHAGLHRRAVAAVLGRGRPAGDDEGSALRRHGGAQPQHRRGLSAGRRAAHQPDRPRDWIEAVRQAGNPGRAGEVARRGDRRSAFARDRLLQAHASIRPKASW